MAKLLFKEPKDKPEEQKVDIEALIKENKELRDEFEKILALDDINFLSEEASKRLKAITKRMLEITKIIIRN